MTPDHSSPAAAPARRPSDTVRQGFPGPLFPALFSLSMTVGAVALLMLYPTVASLVMAAIAMVVAIIFLMSFIWAMLDDRNAP